MIRNKSKQFNFELDGVTYYAEIQYYIDGDGSIEVDAENPSNEVYEKAWQVAEEKGLLDNDGYYGEGREE